MATETNTGSSRMGRRLARIAWLPLSIGVLAIGCAACGLTVKPAGAATATAAPSSTSAPTPPHALLGAFQLSGHGFTFASDGPSEMVMTTTVLKPGKTSGWHTHPGPAFVIVISGTVTRYQAGADGTCTSTTYTAGQGFVEAPGIVHVAVNAGSTPATLEAVFLEVPAGTVKFKSPAALPAGCPGIG